MIRYTITIAEPDRHTVSVSITFTPGAATERIAIPAWIPGSYVIRDFARYLGEMSATDETGSDRAIRKVAKGTWELHAEGAESVTVRYNAYADELTVRTPHVDGSHAFLTGANICCYVDGRLDEPVSVSVDLPGGWALHTPLESGEDGRLHADDYDTLADTPFEAGPDLPTHRFEALGVEHTIVCWGAAAVDLDLRRLADDMRAVVETNAEVFDGRLPYERYLFILHVSAEGRGGLEHRTSSVCALPWRYFDTQDGYREMLGLIAHEHFHAWNVKRIRPRTLGPFDYQSENHTPSLWMAEGVTSYFDNLACVQSGRWTRQQYFEAIAKDIGRLLAVPGRRAQSLAGASWDAWIRLYKPDANTANRTVSYYLKGSLVSLALDLTIRQGSDGECGLQHLMRVLWRRFEESGDGFDEEEVPGLIQDATGVDVSAEVAAWVHGTEDPGFAKLFESHGVEFTLDAEEEAPWFGLELDRAGTDVVVKSVRSDGPGAGSGVYAGDVLAAVAGRRATPGSVNAALHRCTVDEPVPVHVFRRQRLVEAIVTPTAAPPERVELKLREGATDREQRLLDAWLGPEAEHENGKGGDE